MTIIAKGKNAQVSKDGNLFSVVVLGELKMSTSIEKTAQAAYSYYESNPKGNYKP
jgi:hypothetical protein